MSKLHNLQSKHGARKKAKRAGRGNASGLGTYAGRGRNGQNSRTGGGTRPGFEGGQTPLYRKMPKLRGFKNVNRINFQVVNVEKLNKFADGEEIDIAKLYDQKLIFSKTQPVKVLGDGELKLKLTVKVDRVSNSAKAKIEKAKGTVIELMKKEEASTKSKKKTKKTAEAKSTKAEEKAEAKTD